MIRVQQTLINCFYKTLFNISFYSYYDVLGLFFNSHFNFEVSNEAKDKKINISFILNIL